MRRAIPFTALAVMSIFPGAILTSCREGPMEEAGEEIDEAADDAGDAVDEAADEIDDATDDGN
jgi:hypothetical protein